MSSSFLPIPSLCSCFLLQHFFPCFRFSWVHSSSAVQFAFQTQFWQHCWALCWPLRSTVTLTAVGAPQVFSLETAELLCASSPGGPEKQSSVPRHLLALSCSLVRMKSLSVFKFLSLLINSFSAARRVAAQFFFLFISETLVILCCCSLSSYQNCLWVDILFSFWNISCEDLNIFPTAPINLLAIIWLKTLQGEKKNLILWFNFTKSGTQEFSLVFFLFNEILVGSSLGTFLVDSFFFSSIGFFIIYFSFCEFVLDSFWQQEQNDCRNLNLPLLKILP